MTEKVESPKKSVRTRKTAATATSPEPQTTALLNPLITFLTNLATQATTLKDEAVMLQKSIDEVRERWKKEQQQHEVDVKEQGEELERRRKREEEEYAYQKIMERKKETDEFAERKARWEKELAEQKEVIAAERRELAELRKKVAAFDDEVSKAVKQASASLTEELEEKVAFERKLREQEVKSEKELLALKITSLTSENTRLTSEIERLKKSLDDATRQLKEIAVKVIESKAPKQENVEG